MNKYGLKEQVVASLTLKRARIEQHIVIHCKWRVTLINRNPGSKKVLIETFATAKTIIFAYSEYVKCINFKVDYQNQIVNQNV